MEIQKNVPLKNFTTVGVGGPADFFVEVRSIENLREVVRFASKNSIPIFPLGGGSNIIFADTGFRGVVARIAIDDFEISPDGVVAAGAGVQLPRFVAECVGSNLAVGHLAGIPGMLGGALAGNAGPRDFPIGDFVVSAEVFDSATGEIWTRDREWFDFKYRESRIKNEPRKHIILRANFRFPRDSDADPALRDADLRHAEAKCRQPRGRSPGCFFRNPPDGSAGKMIDECGLRGFKIGGAEISSEHANFFLNSGGATAADFRALAKLAQTAVRERFAVELDPEVRVLDEVGTAIKKF